MSLQWYYEENGAQQGPVDAKVLKKLVAQGRVNPQTLLWKEGMANWVPAASVKGLFPDDQSVPPEAKDSSIGGHSSEAAHILDHLLPHIRNVIGASGFESLHYFFIRLGKYAQWVALFALFSHYIVRGLKIDSVKIILSGLMMTMLLLILQYWAQRLSTTIDQMIKNTAVKLSSTAIINGFCISCFIGAFCLPFYYLLISFQANEELVPSIVLSILIGFSLVYLGSLTLHHSTLNISVDEKTSAGEEAIGILGLAMRIIFHFAPIFYAVGMVVLSIALLGMTFSLIKGGEEAMASFVYGFAIEAGLYWTASVPILAYTAFIFYSLFTDLIRAILSLPRIEEELRSDS